MYAQKTDYFSIFGYKPVISLICYMHFCNHIFVPKTLPKNFCLVVLLIRGLNLTLNVGGKHLELVVENFRSG